MGQPGGQFDSYIQAVQQQIQQLQQQLQQYKQTQSQQMGGYSSGSGASGVDSAYGGALRIGGYQPGDSEHMSAFGGGRRTGVRQQSHKGMDRKPSESVRSSRMYGVRQRNY